MWNTVMVPTKKKSPTTATNLAKNVWERRKERNEKKRKEIISDFYFIIIINKKTYIYIYKIHWNRETSLMPLFIRGVVGCCCCCCWYLFVRGSDCEEFIIN